MKRSWLFLAPLTLTSLLAAACSNALPTSSGNPTPGGDTFVFAQPCSC
ncbi:MAG: hypothetical protein ACMG6S_31410 [Byssovorax sp.]